MMLRREVESARHAGRITGPADRAAGEAVRAFDPPADADIRFRAFASRAGPDIVPRGGAAAVVILEHVEVDAVIVLEPRPRVRAGAGEDAVGRAKPVAESVQVM